MLRRAYEICRNYRRYIRCCVCSVGFGPDMGCHHASDTKLTNVLPESECNIRNHAFGTELSVKIPAGLVHRAPVAQDGKVELHYDSTASALGTITIFGNAQTRTLALTSSRRRECVFALVETVLSEPDSAYAGATGDWALGRWNGLQVRNVQGVGLQSSSYSLLVERHRNGMVLCRFGDPEAVTIVLWASRCAITAETANIVSGEAELSLQRVATNQLQGTMRYPGGSATIRLSR